MLQAMDQTIRLHPQDDVVIARLEIAGGTVLAKENVRAAGPIPAGHKIAVRAVAQGNPVRRYDQIIGFATRDIAAGEHVHVYLMGPDAAPEAIVRELVQSAVRAVVQLEGEPQRHRGIGRRLFPAVVAWPAGRFSGRPTKRQSA
jgi:hypothetical protein